MGACFYGHFEIARWLMGLGANIHLQNKVSRALSIFLSLAVLSCIIVIIVIVMCVVVMV